MEIEQTIDGQTPAGEFAPAQSAGPNNPPWGVWEGIGVWVASVMFILFVPAIFLLPYLALHKPPILDNEHLVEFAKSDPTAVLLQIGAILPAHLLTVLIAWVVVTRMRKYNFREMVGWRSGGFRWWQYIAILVGFGLIAIGAAKVYPEQENDLIQILRTSREAVYIVAFVATFTAPFVEEVVYRGVVYSALQRAWGVPAAFLLTTALFAVVHVPQYWPSYSTIFLLTLLSLILTTIRVRTNNLLPCIIFHTLFNGLQSISLLAEPLAKSSEVPDPTAAILRLIGF